MKNISCYGFLLKLTDYLLFAGLTHAAILSADRQALTALYNSADGDGWDDKNSWKTPPPDSDGFAMPGTVCNWYGVQCGGDAVNS
jgi:hypothetical protein